IVWLGFSLGASASARAALRAVEREAAAAGSNTVLAFSGAFQGVPEDPDPYRAERSWLLERVLAEGSVLPGDWYLEVGTLEWLVDVTQRVAAALAERGAAVVLRQRNAGHNWTSWRNGLPDALRFALGR